MPVDIALPDIPTAISEFYNLVESFGRNPDEVEITMVVMAPVSGDLLKSYRDMGIHRCNIGVGVENWDRPEVADW